jgi:hypothetical protein
MFGIEKDRATLASMNRDVLLRRIHIWLVLFIVGLVLSGLTAFPLAGELVLVNKLLGVPVVAPEGAEPALHAWLRRVMVGVVTTDRSYPFMAYGTDWLGFGHLVIAMAFIGPLRDPVRNKWIFTFGIFACAGVIPLALIAGQVRGIPFYWRLIDCSFGVFGVLPLLLCLRYVRRLESMG